jgi:hypothetical protein
METVARRLLSNRGCCQVRVNGRYTRQDRFSSCLPFIAERRSEMKGTDMHNEPDTAAVIEQ